MAKYEIALPFTLAFEGNFQALASDPGNYYQGTLCGTAFGITFENFVAWRLRQGKPAPTVADLKSITPIEVSAFYRAGYWDAIAGDQLSDQNVAAVLFDSSVLQGPVTVVKMAQPIAAGIAGQPLLADGRCGPKTLAAINACERRKLLEPLVHKMQSRFLDIASANPAQKSWLSNWMRRAAAWLVLADT